MRNHLFSFHKANSPETTPASGSAENFRAVHKTSQIQATKIDASIKYPMVRPLWDCEWCQWSALKLGQFNCIMGPTGAGRPRMTQPVQCWWSMGNKLCRLWMVIGKGFRRQMSPTGAGRSTMTQPVQCCNFADYEWPLARAVFDDNDATLVTFGCDNHETWKTRSFVPFNGNIMCDKWVVMVSCIVSSSTKRTFYCGQNPWSMEDIGPLLLSGGLTNVHKKLATTNGRALLIMCRMSNSEYTF
jgi:hypothetical protein